MTCANHCAGHGRANDGLLLSPTSMDLIANTSSSTPSSLTYRCHPRPPPLCPRSLLPTQHLRLLPGPLPLRLLLRYALLGPRRIPHRANSKRLSASST
uniref:Uncharacterized protein n=1 Tax=Oryza sativa subsp. japonica TaxID=39947 RepID=Q69XD5_ORYSJ|nr:hypothetical protein [Oryza sativa Japonica Group]